MTATSVTKVVTLCALTALLIAGCGRKGDLEIPSSQPAAEKQDGTEEEADEDRPFILDALIK